MFQVKLLPKQGTCVPRKTKQTNQPFETTFRLQVKQLFSRLSHCRTGSTVSRFARSQKPSNVLGKTAGEFRALFRIAVEPIESTLEFLLTKKLMISFISVVHCRFAIARYMARSPANESAAASQRERESKKRKEIENANRCMLMKLRNRANPFFIVYFRNVESAQVVSLARTKEPRVFCASL